MDSGKIVEGMLNKPSDRFPFFSVIKKNRYKKSK